MALLSFLFIFLPRDLPSTRLLVQSAHPFSLHSPTTSCALSLSSLPQRGLPIAVVSSFLNPQVLPRRFWLGGGRGKKKKKGEVRVAAGSASYPICVSIMRSCPLNPALIHQPASRQARAALSAMVPRPSTTTPNPADTIAPSLSHAHCTPPLTNGTDGFGDVLFFLRDHPCVLEVQRSVAQKWAFSNDVHIEITATDLCFL